MTTAIKLYIRSRVIPSGLTTLPYSYDYHYHFEQNYWGIYHSLRERGWSKGRVFEQERRPSCLLELVEAGREQVRVYDLGLWRGRIKAILAGVNRTPAVVLEGEKSVVLQVAQEALRSLGG